MRGGQLQVKMDCVLKQWKCAVFLMECDCYQKQLTLHHVLVIWSLVRSSVTLSSLKLGSFSLDLKITRLKDHST